MKRLKHVANVIAAVIALLTAASGSSLAAQTNNADRVAQLEQRVSQLEKQVQEISQFLEPLKGQQATIANRRKALEEKLSQRTAMDQNKYSVDEVIEAEKLYMTVSSKSGTPEASESFQTLVKKYPESNRAGCAALYMAQRAQGDDRVKRLQECIDKYNDCIYGDEVQVGAYARFLLAREYLRLGDDKKAAVLAKELKTAFPDAVDHGGNLLLEQLAR